MGFLDRVKRLGRRGNTFSEDPRSELNNMRTRSSLRRWPR